MKTPLAINRFDDWLLPGSPSDSRLFHADEADRIWVYPPHLGRGYYQEIPLQDDVSLIIQDLSLDHNLVTTPVRRDRLKFEFRLAGFDAGYSSFVPDLGLRELKVIRAQKRVFEIEVIFQQPSLIAYAQAFTERLSPPILAIAKRILQSIYRCQGGSLLSTTADILHRIIHCGTSHDRSASKGWTMPSAIAPNSDFTEYILPATLYADAIDLDHIARRPITPAMTAVIGQILSCPYQGVTRRAYLERKALELVSLRLEAMVQPRLKESELARIHQAASILRKQVANPPTVDALARLVNTNRCDLNRGFREVYGTTPFDYSRNSRLFHARWLLMTSDQSIVNVAAAVGYTSRSRFAAAFRQGLGVNPKTFQMQAWQCVSQPCPSKNCG